MSKLDIKDYANKIRKAYTENDLEAVKAIESKYGHQEVNMADVEELNSLTINLIGSTMMSESTINAFKFDLLLNLLVDKGVITGEDVAQLACEVDNLVNKIEKGE